MKSRDDRAVKFDFVSNFMAPNIRLRLAALDDSVKRSVFEVRIKAGAPIMLSIGSECVPVSTRTHESEPYTVTAEDMRRTFEFVTGSSLHTVLHELRGGFVTISGGHRVGVCGKVVMENGEVSTIRDISSLNFRIAHQVTGCADEVIKEIAGGGRVKSTIIISPPSCGKTTMLRDIARQLSNGVESLGFSGVKVGVVDERSEICAMYRGVMQNDVGMRTDVLDSCPKHIGINLMLRSMSPNVIITDELLTDRDVDAVMTAHNTGVAVIASVHGESVEQVKEKPVFSRLFSEGVFSLAIMLSNSPKVGTPALHRLL